MAYDIIKGETLPPPIMRAIYPFRDLEVGDCFEAPAGKRGSIANVASAQGARLGRRFSVRKHDANTVRVWRIA